MYRNNSTYQFQNISPSVQEPSALTTRLHTLSVQSMMEPAATNSWTTGRNPLSTATRRAVRPSICSRSRRAASKVNVGSLQECIEQSRGHCHGGAPYLICVVGIQTVAQESLDGVQMAPHCCFHQRRFAGLASKNDRNNVSRSTPNNATTPAVALPCSYMTAINPSYQQRSVTIGTQSNVHVDYHRPSSFSRRYQCRAPLLLKHTTVSCWMTRRLDTTPSQTTRQSQNDERMRHCALHSLCDVPRPWNAHDSRPRRTLQ